MRALARSDTHSGRASRIAPRSSTRSRSLAPRAREPRPQGADAAGDVEADPARGDDALLGIEGGDAPDGEAVAPVGVGHGEGGGENAGQGRDVRDRLVDLVVHGPDERLPPGEGA